MANALTGDFDVVAEFAVLAVDRLLAAMHQTGRFFHSISAQVDDSPHTPVGPTIVGTVDTFGDAVANQLRIGSPNPSPGASAATDAALARLGPVVNFGELVAYQPPIVPSHISGIVQLQLFPPTIVAPNAPGANLTVRMNLMARFFPDKNTAPLAEFIRGDLQISAPVNKVATGRVHVLDIDFKADEANISFTPTYSSQTLSPEDLAGINLCIRNGLRTSFLPSSVTLPSSITNVQLKTLPGAIAVLLDFNSHPSTPASITNVFLSGNDGFAFAAGRDYVLNALRPISANILSQPPQSITIPALSLHFSFLITLNSANCDLQAGNIVLTIKAHAKPTNHTWVGSADFTVTVKFSLQASGNTVQLGLQDVSVSFDSGLSGAFADFVDYFTGDVSGNVRNAVEAALAASDASATVDQMFNVDTNLANFLNAQLNPSDGNPPAQPQLISLMYTSVDIQSAGIVLHGMLFLHPWPDPYVEFEQVPSHPTGLLGPTDAIDQGPDYSALKTWIPGGAIAEFDWSLQGQTTPFKVDPNTFVLLHSGPNNAVAEAYSAVVAYSPICLTVKGNRISNYGAFYDPVVARVCGFTKFHVGDLVGVSPGRAALPALAVTHPGPGGEVVVSGHTSAEVDKAGGAAPNLIVHFADSKSAANLQPLTQALQRSKRTDAPTAIIAVLTPDQLSKARYTPGIVYTGDHDGWQNALGVKSAQRPLTLIVSPRGSFAWQHEGVLEPDKLAAALNRHLVKRGPVPISMPRLNLRIGQPAPNFLFEYSPGREMPLRKLAGQPLLLVFWKSSVKPSLQAVRDLQAAAAQAEAPAPLVLAINDGEDPEVVRTAAAESGFTAILVTDPKREISISYGVTLLPTIVTLSTSGVVAGIRYGHVPGDQPASPSRPASAQATRNNQKSGPASTR